MQEIRTLLDEPLNVDDGHVLAAQLVQAEAWGARVSQKFREAEETLSLMKGKTFNPSLSSEDKRKVDLEFKVRAEQRQVNELADLADIIKRRISLGQSLLKNFQVEMQSGVNLGVMQ